MKNNALRKKHVRDERRRRANERTAKARGQRQQPTTTARNVITIDFNPNKRPVIHGGKSNVRYGNPRPVTEEQAA